MALPVFAGAHTAVSIQNGRPGCGVPQSPETCPNVPDPPCKASQGIGDVLSYHKRADHDAAKSRTVRQPYSEPYSKSIRSWGARPT